MNVLDLGMMGVVVASTLIAAAHGFFFELFALAGVIAGYVLAAWQYTRLAPRFMGLVKAAWVADLAAFLIIFFVVLLVATVIGRIARWGVAAVGLRFVDRVLGAAFGLARGLLLVAVVVLGMATFAPNAGLLVNSAGAPYVLLIGRAVIWVAPARVREQFHAGLATLRTLADHGQQVMH